MAKAPFKLRSGNSSAFKNLGSSPAKQEDYSSPSPRYTSPVDHPDGPAGNNKPPNGSTKGGGNKRKTTKPKEGPITPKSPTFNPPPPSNNENKGTVRGITEFEYDFPKTNKVIDLHNKVIKKGFNNIKKGGKKVYDYFTKK